jgi:hypothetical protein
MPACEMTGDSPTQPVLKATTWTALSLCRACGNPKREHDSDGGGNLLHGQNL